jgi:hypothetical protein
MKHSYLVVGFTFVNMACTSDPAPNPMVDAAVSQEPDSGRACPALNLTNCGAAYGCVNLDAASEKWLEQCSAYDVNIRHEGCGYDILQHSYGEGDTFLAFYHPESGELKGWWNESDTLEITCAGAVPRECLDYGFDSPGVNVCDSPDAAAIDTSATDTHTISSEAGPPELTEGGPTEAGVTGTLPDGGSVECCEPSAAPDCCMDYGGANLYGCGMTCDGMPLPSDGWTMGIDKYGCPVWVEPPVSDSCCGCPEPTPDAGVDDGGTSSGSTSNASDAGNSNQSHDASAPASDASLDAAP